MGAGRSAGGRGEVTGQGNKDEKIDRSLRDRRRTGSRGRRGASPQVRRPGLPALLPRHLPDGPAPLVRDAVKRNIVRLLQYVEIPRRLAGKVYAHCVDLIDDAHEPVAVRAFALTVAARIAKSEPGLMNELRLIARKHLPHTTIAFQKRAREVL